MAITPAHLHAQTHELHPSASQKRNASSTFLPPSILIGVTSVSKQLEHGALQSPEQSHNSSLLRQQGHLFSPSIIVEALVLRWQTKTIKTQRTDSRALVLHCQRKAGEPLDSRLQLTDSKIFEEKKKKFSSFCCPRRRSWPLVARGLEAVGVAHMRSALGLSSTYRQQKGWLPLLRKTSAAALA
jgi:hypothetical protein